MVSLSHDDVLNLGRTSDDLSSTFNSLELVAWTNFSALYVKVKQNARNMFALSRRRGLRGVLPLIDFHLLAELLESHMINIIFSDSAPCRKDIGQVFKVNLSLSVLLS